MCIVVLSFCLYLAAYIQFSRTQYALFDPKTCKVGE